MVVAELAVVALVGDALVIAGRELAEVAVLRVDPLEERVEGRAEIEAAAAPVADFEYPRRLLRDGVARKRGGEEIDGVYSLSPSSPLVNRLACDRSAFASVSNHSASSA